MILGNHDNFSTHEYLKYFTKVHGALGYKGGIITHIPIHKSQLDRYYFNIHGHLHNERIADKRFMNVNCDIVGFKPRTYGEINSLTQEALKALNV